MNDIKIVYTSNTGMTAQYAKMIGEKTGNKVYSLDEAKKELKKGDNIIYLGWVFANMVSKYKKANKLFNIKAICAVGLSKTGENKEAVRTVNKIREETVLFTLQGGMNRDKLKGIKKFMINMLYKSKDKMKTKTKAEEDMVYIIANNLNLVKEENLNEFMSWYNSNNE